jgi:hypothetical protein
MHKQKGLIVYIYERQKKFALYSAMSSRTGCEMKEATASSILLVVVQLAALSIGEAQQSRSVRWIGYPFTGFRPPKEFLEAMHKLGYTEGRNIITGYRVTEGRDGRQVIENHISGDHGTEWSG